MFDVSSQVKKVLAYQEEAVPEHQTFSVFWTGREAIPAKVETDTYENLSRKFPMAGTYSWGVSGAWIEDDLLAMVA